MNDFVNLFDNVIQVAFLSVEMKIYAHIVEGKVNNQCYLEDWRLSTQKI